MERHPRVRDLLIRRASESLLPGNNQRPGHVPTVRVLHGNDHAQLAVRSRTRALDWDDARRKRMLKVREDSRVCRAGFSLAARAQALQHQHEQHRTKPNRHQAYRQVHASLVFARSSPPRRESGASSSTAESFFLSRDLLFRYPMGTSPQPQTTPRKRSSSTKAIETSVRQDARVAFPRP